ncbi:MAG: hypothetical protein C0610_16780 [Desulfobacteraceae bacterium]|nr:MAG: hypothetical protein C0610_16780 [Desulfobacteraceae bacterium]
MGYFAAYRRQVKAFYVTMWRNLFAPKRNLDGNLQSFILKPGFFWEFLDMHRWFFLAVARLPMLLLQLAFGYLALVVVMLLVFIAPVVIILAFPIFTFKRYRRIKREGQQL